MNIDNMKIDIKAGNTSLGIEFGSTRIKAVLLSSDNSLIAVGKYDWENRFESNVWTYSQDDIWNGLQSCYKMLAEEVKNKYSEQLTNIGAIGFSGMMHGYMAFDSEGELLVSFRTWRNTITEEASEKLTSILEYPIPQRWSIAHLYQAILNKEEHVSKISHFTTLAGYVHWKLTGKKVLGIGEASGMFPIDIDSKSFNKNMIAKFNELNSVKAFSWKLEEILPEVLTAGDIAGTLTDVGAKLLDPTGCLNSGSLMCPPEGDAGTGMVATNSISKRIGNVSAGTSVFAMVVLEKDLSKVYSEIDQVTTPTGNLVAMVHCNNCTSDLNAWVNLFKEFAETFSMDIDIDTLYSTLYKKALEGDADCGGLLAYNYFSGEHITGLDEGRPLFVRTPESKFNLANFIRVHLFTSLGALKIGMDILKQEKVEVDNLFGHGGFFKIKEVGPMIMASALNIPVTIMETADEGGAWGIAVLASYAANKSENETLDEFLESKIFIGQTGTFVTPNYKDVEGFEIFLERYIKGLEIEKAAVKSFKI